MHLTHANILRRKTNHSARKSIFTQLLPVGIAPTTIQQLTGHKDKVSVIKYATASLNMQKDMSKILVNDLNKEKIDHV